MPVDEAAWLVFAHLGLDHHEFHAVYGERQGYKEDCRMSGGSCSTRRIEERVPARLSRKQAWFAGLEFYVDERVLVPRSPFAELDSESF